MIFILVGLLALSGGANAATVTTATGGGAIDSNTAPSCAAESWSTLTGPAITETAAANIGLGNIVLTAPSGFEFDPTASVTILLTGNGTASRNINNVATGTSMAVNSITSTAITFTVTEVGTRSNKLTWQGIKVRPTVPTSVSGNITHTGTSTISGVTTNSTNLGTLTEVISSPVCNEPSATTNAATSPTTTGATLNGTVSSNGANTAVTFDYGLTTSYGGSPPAAATPSTLLAGTSSGVSSVLTGLTCNTTYHFRVNGSSSLGTTNGSDLTFTTSACPAVTSINTANATPSNASAVSWTVTFNTSVTGVNSSNFTLVNSGLGGTPVITGVSGSGTTWTVTASTGTGTGTLGLDMANVTGISPAVTPTTFTGQVYSIDRTAPVVSSIALADPTPTALASVSWAVTFSKSVTGVNAADFALVQAGGVSGAAITSVTGSGTSWTVTASTGTGNGTLGLNLADDDSIVDAASNPLGGTGASNGDFSGDIYSVARPSSPTACTNDTSIGTKAWSTLTGPVTSDNAYATASVDDNQITNYLKCTGYGLAIPTNAIIEGITVGVERFANNTNLQDAAMRIVKGGVIGATDRSKAGLYPNADPNTYDDHGGVTELWGETWTPADINSANFGVALASQKSNNTGGSRTISVDHMAISVAYRLPVNCTSNASSNWTLPTTWTNCRGGVPLAGDEVTILSIHTVTLNTTTPVLGDLTNGGTLNASGTNTLSIGGNFVNNGTVSLGSSNVDLYGNFSNTTGTSFNLGATDSGTWTFRGTLLQNIDSTSILTTFPKLALNNALGIALNASATVKTLLTLTTGYISTSNNSLTLSANCTDVTSTNGTSWVRTNGFVNGNLRLAFPSGSTTCTFPVGSGTTYAPIKLVLTASASGTTLTGSTTGNEYPQISTAGIDATKDVNRYWSLWATGDATTAVTNYSPIFNFVTGDVDTLATPTNFVVGKYNSSVWSLITPQGGSALATSTGISIAAGITAQTDFVVGEATFVCSVPAGSPAGTTCVCDNFSRTSLNPSTIYSGNWNVSSSGSTSFLPQIVNNRLRLTNNSTGVSAAATGPGTFPAAGNWITVEFKHYAYGGTGADGIAFTLSDSAISAVPGAFGGSLGYAQKSNPGSDCAISGGCPGFAGGWVGIAIDEYGNFSANTEGRTGGTAPGQVVDSVAVRGSGSGQAGYSYLAGTGTLSPPIDNPSPATDGFGYAYRLTVDARCYQLNGTDCSNPSLGKKAQVTVERDTTGTGNSYPAVPMLSFDAYAVNPSQADVPTNWQLSFTGSTGATTNIHEIVGMKVCAQTYVPPAGYRILVDNFSPTTCASDPQPTVTISALDSNSNIITTYTNTVNLSATLLGGGASSATWTSQGTNLGTFDSVNKRYTFAAGDNGVAKFTLSDTIQQNVYITVSEYLGTLNSSLGTPVQYSSGVASFIVDTPPADALGSNVVAGRPHLMSIKRNQATCGGGVNATYTGIKPLDGWYSPAAGDHPNGAAAPQICQPVAGTCLPSHGACQTLSIAAPVVSASSNNLDLTFNSGIAYFCLVTTDVGKYSLSLRDDKTDSALPVTGSSSTLTARPFAVVVSDVNQGAVANPADATSDGSIFAKAGTSFEAKVGGYLWNSPGDGNGDGFPDSGATFAQLTDAGVAPYYADTVTLAANIPFAPTTTLDILPGTGAAGSLGNGSIVLTGGSVTPSTLNYSEVGTFTLKASPTTNYLNSGVDLLTSRTAIFAGSLNARTSLVGRFIPDHFGISGSTLTNRSDINAGTGCAPASAFTYMGEPIKASFTLTAQNALGGQTLNYAGAYAKFVSPTGTGYSNANSLGMWGIVTGYTYGGSTCSVLFDSATPSVNSFASCSGSMPTLSIGRTAGPRITVASPDVPTWTGGVATFTTDVILERGDAPDGSYDMFNIGVAPQDSEGVKLQASALNLDANNDTISERFSLGTTQLMFGRLSLQNANGSELLALPVPLTAEIWNGISWINNEVDNCTDLTVPTSESGLTLNLASSGTTAATLSKPLLSGNADLSLAAPGATHTGYVDITINSPDWLDFDWKGEGDTDPTARATFGIYKGNSKFIYIRELY
ncbi:MAG: hypothetical protein Q7T96_07595 [Methylobacter sp.]|nr:hypothetical protein [Methylobacter sp.]